MEHKRAFSEPSLLLERQRRDTGTLKALMEHKRGNTICRSCFLNDSSGNKGALKAFMEHNKETRSAVLVP